MPHSLFRTKRAGRNIPLRTEAQRPEEQSRFRLSLSRRRYFRGRLSGNPSFRPSGHARSPSGCKRCPPYLARWLQVGLGKGDAGGLLPLSALRTCGILPSPPNRNRFCDFTPRGTNLFQKTSSKFQKKKTTTPSTVRAGQLYWQM